MAVQAVQHTQLKQLILQALDLSVVPSQVLARFVNRLDKFSISNCTITDEQARDMFDKMAKETELKELEIHGSDLSTVDNDKLAICVKNLNKVNIDKGSFKYYVITYRGRGV